MKGQSFFLPRAALLLCAAFLLGASPVVLLNSLAQAAPPSRLIWPVPAVDAEAVGRTYGEYVLDTRHPYHTGLDIRATAGTPVVAARTGTLRLLPMTAGRFMGDNHCMGNVVIIDHGGFYTLYAHLQTISNRVNGSSVSAGDIIGWVGNTPSGTRCGTFNPHLHFEVKSRGVLGDTADTGDINWGYTPAHPDEHGYHDPILYLHAHSDFSSSRRVRVTTAGQGALLRIGPGSYRTLGSLSAGEEFLAIREGPGTSNPDCQGWFQLRKLSGDFTDPSPSHGESVRDAWVCKQSGSAAWLQFVTSAMSPNDNFADRMTIIGPSATVHGSNVGASKEAGEPNHHRNSGGASLWWSWTAPISGEAEITTVGSDFDTALAVYTGTSLSALTQIASDDDDGGNRTSRVHFQASAGSTYQIAVDGYGGSSGNIVLSVRAASPPPNDNFANRLTITGTLDTAHGSNLGATKETGEPNHAENSGARSVWWTWTAPVSGAVEIDTFGSDFATVVAIYTGNSVSALVFVASDDSSADGSIGVEFQASAGSSYQIAVDGYGGRSDNIGNIHINLHLTPVRELGRWPGFVRGDAHDVKVVGNYAYVASYDAGLQILDVRDPSNPIRVGGYDTSGEAKRLQVVGDYAYVADYDGGLQVIDIHNPANPVGVASYRNGYAHDVQVVGDYAYVAGGDLEILDIRNPASLRYVGRYVSNGSVVDVQVAGNYAYLAVGSAGLQIIDIREPANPVLVGGYRTNGLIETVEVVGNYAYVGGYNAGLQIVDIGNPANPVRIGSSDIGDPKAVQVVGNYAYVADWLAGLRVIDIRSPANSIRVGGYNTSGFAEGMHVVGNYAYVAAHDTGLQIIDIRSPANPVRVSAYNTSGYAQSIHVIGNYAYVADWSAGLQIIDFANPSNPVRVGGYDTSGKALGVQVVGNYAYVADDNNGLQIIDIRNPATPVRVGGYRVYQAESVQVVGDYANVTAGFFGLEIIDIRDPTNPIRVGGYDTDGLANALHVVGNYAYVADDNAGLQIIDVGNPANPVHVGGYADTIGFFSADGVQVVGNYAYVADFHAGLQIIDIRNPATPLRISRYNTSRPARAVQVVGNFAYIANWDAGLRIVDIRNPATPVRAGGYHTRGHAEAVQVVGNRIYIADGDWGLLILEQSGIPVSAERQLQSLSIKGAGAVSGRSVTTYRCVAYFSDGSSSDVTASATWSVVGTKPEGTGFRDNNSLYAGSALSRFPIQIRAEYADATGKRTSEPFILTIEPSRFNVTFTHNAVYTLRGRWTVTFTATSSGPNGGAVNYQWDLDGDGVFDNGSGAQISRSYDAGLTHVVRVQATDSIGATAEYERYVTVEKRSDVPASREPAKLISPSDPASGRLLDSLGNRFAFDVSKRSTGLIIVTHGLWSAGEFEWLSDMANAITNRLGVIERSPVPNVAIYDWKESANPNRLTKEGTGFSASLLYASAFVGDIILDLWLIRPYALAQGVDLADWIESQIRAGNVDATKPIHLIGHSAGGFVMGECASVLKRRGIQISQVTMLDTPFPYRHHFVQYPNPGNVERYISYLGGCRFRPPAPPLNFAPELETCLFPGLPLAHVVSPGPYYYRQDIPGLHLHAYAHDWYTANTIQASEPDGFYYSPFLNHALPSKSSSSLALQSRTKQSQSAQTNTETILTGFETFGEVQVSNGVYRVTEEVNAGIFKDIVLSIGAQYVKFRYRFASAGDGDFLSVHWGTNAPLYVGPDLPFTREGFAEAQVPLTEFAGQTGQLVLKLVARGNTNAVLLLDQIRLEISSDPDHDGLSTEQEQTLGTNSLLADSDGDGLSDADEMKVYQTNPLNRDSDGDGLIDGEELLAGTSPADRESVLKITSVGMDSNRNLTLRWAGATNRLYRVNRSEGLLRDNYSTLTNGVPGIQPLNTFTDYGVTNRSFFYWLEVEGDPLQ